MAGRGVGGGRKEVGLPDGCPAGKLKKQSQVCDGLSAGGKWG